MLLLLSQVVVQVLDHCVGCMLDVRDSFNNYIVFYYFTIQGMELQFSSGYSPVRQWPGNNTAQMQSPMRIR
jgi:hypothetical protein